MHIMHIVFVLIARHMRINPWGGLCSATTYVRFTGSIRISIMNRCTTHTFYIHSSWSFFTLRTPMTLFINAQLFLPSESIQCHSITLNYPNIQHLMIENNHNRRTHAAKPQALEMYTHQQRFFSNIIIIILIEQQQQQQKQHSNSD